MKNIQVYVGNNDELRRLVFKKFTELGYSHPANTINTPCTGYVGKPDGTLLISQYNKIQFNQQYKEIMDVADFLSDIPITVQLNENYTAEIDYKLKIIEVACQTITFEKVKELYDKINNG